MRSAPYAARLRLGDLLVRRRIELAPRYRSRTLFAAEHGLNWRLLYDIERARRTNFAADTLSAIEVAYRWRQGSIAAVLAGGEPAALPSGPERRELPEPDPLDAVSQVPGLTDAERQAFRALADALRAARRERPDGTASGTPA